MQSNPLRSSNKYNGYRKSNLVTMTTIQLKEICIKEKIINGILNPLNRGELIDKIMRFRGIPEDLLIRKHCEGGFERVGETILKKIGTKREGSHSIVNPSKMIFYTGLEMTEYEGYSVKIEEHVSSVEERKEKCFYLNNTNALLMDETRKLCGILNIVSSGDEQTFYLIKSSAQEIEISQSKQYFIYYFDKKESDYLFYSYYEGEDKPVILDYYQVPLANVEVREVEDTNAVLAIDFGSTNTTVGAYLDYNYINLVDEKDVSNGSTRLDDINIALFQNTSVSSNEFSPVIPTLASVAKCTNDEAIFHFGYEAEADSKIKFYDENFSIFYEMKRWVETYNQEQDIVDIKGNTMTITRGEIIRNYLLYVIRKAEDRFKCRFHKLHLSCPVKLKEQFSQMFEELLWEYELMTQEMLDEGSAVLYNTIHNMIGKKTYYNNEYLSAMIIDCGGGTTDLSSCKFRITNENSTYRVNIDTSYENGEANFGGNNITYRIMQYLKIVLAAYYMDHCKVNVSDYIDEKEMDIYRAVDSKGRQGVYEAFERAYQLVEKVIPTKYKEFENRSKEEYFLVKNNLDFLFSIAEQLKKKFYQYNNSSRIKFALKEAMSPDDCDLIVLDAWNLVIRRNDKLCLQHEIPEIVFCKMDIDKLMKADIYWIINRFLGDMFETGELEDYSVIKLSGQSCKIDLFKDAIKEFIPGKCIDFRTSKQEAHNVFDLKMACVRGLIQYIHDVETGRVRMELNTIDKKIPYMIVAYTHENTKKILINQIDTNQGYGYLSLGKELTKVEFLLYGEDGEVKYRYPYYNDASNYEPYTFEEISERYEEYSNCIVQSETDTIKDYEVKFFVFAANDRWGFYVVPIAREETQLYLGEEKYYAFENNIWEVNFFDGTK
ncbi:hypothetical protein [Anaerosporobacter sp.]|uniref:hypothetical protein n=1 Tax=Anaerosporobacter sp. TaxID=1872529 RepID=UPI00286F8F6C|nr:hypothetical protein [Anaerosporobacter sp.]